MAMGQIQPANPSSSSMCRGCLGSFPTNLLCSGQRLTLCCCKLGFHKPSQAALLFPDWHMARAGDSLPKLSSMQPIPGAGQPKKSGDGTITEYLAPLQPEGLLHFATTLGESSFYMAVLSTFPLEYSTVLSN